MERVIVTVKREGEARVRDLEVPADVEAGRLAEMIARALHWESDAAGQPVRYQIEAHPLGRVLQAHETLASAEVWDGSWLVFIAEGSRSSARMPGGPPHQPPVRSQGPSGPVTRWRPLEIDLPDTSVPPSAPEEKKPSSGYVWKQID